MFIETETCVTILVLMPKVKQDDDEVGKRPKVAISMAWWKEAWPLEEPCKHDYDVRRAISNYKVTKAGQSTDQFLEACRRLLEAFDKVATVAATEFKRHPLKKRAMLKDLKIAAEMVAKESKQAIASGDQLTLIYKRSFGTAVTDALEKAEISRISVPGRYVELSVPQIIVDELRVSKSYPMLIKFIDQEFEDHITAAKDGIVETILKHKRPSRKLMVDVEKVVDKEFASLCAEVPKLPVKVISRAINSHAIAKKYKIAKAVKVTKATGGVVVATAGVALPGTTAFAVVGLFRAVMGLAMEIQKAAQHVESKIRDLKNDLEYLMTSYEKNSGKKEIRGEALNALFGTEVAATAKGAKEHLSDINKSIAQILARSLKMQKKLEEAQEKCEVLRQSLLSAIPLDNKSRQEKAFDALPEAKSFKKLADNFDELFDKQAKLLERVARSEKDTVALKKGVLDLEKLRNTDVDKAAKIISGIITLAWNTAGITDAVAIGKDIGSVANACIGAADDIASLTRDVKNAF
ncbi:hypothetical protein OEZ60_18745 [Defluviimonas sp. WL0024]|uniref:Uncharacterized protein n=1 Tax=Albidovulum salinarum TaxID=2984153 RepID=A0ABT2X820_9RHOB|nr:hypothetical protein [Defluviimonas sp. WL0024]MCU9850043.1 hypothetical protein [Defluviimonas sp. WL0024]